MSAVSVGIANNIGESRLMLNVPDESAQLLVPTKVGENRLLMILDDKRIRDDGLLKPHIASNHGSGLLDRETDIISGVATNGDGNGRRSVYDTDDVLGVGISGDWGYIDQVGRRLRASRGYINNMGISLGYNDGSEVGVSLQVVRDSILVIINAGPLNILGALSGRSGVSADEGPFGSPR